MRSSAIDFGPRDELGVGLLVEEEVAHRLPDPLGAALACDRDRLRALRSPLAANRDPAASPRGRARDALGREARGGDRAVAAHRRADEDGRAGEGLEHGRAPTRPSSARGRTAAARAVCSLASPRSHIRSSSGSACRRTTRHSAATSCELRGHRRPLAGALEPLDERRPRLEREARACRARARSTGGRRRRRGRTRGRRATASPPSRPSRKRELLLEALARPVLPAPQRVVRPGEVVEAEDEQPARARARPDRPARAAARDSARSGTREITADSGSTQPSSSSTGTFPAGFFS